MKHYFHLVLSCVSNDGTGYNDWLTLALDEYKITEAELAKAVASVDDARALLTISYRGQMTPEEFDSQA